MKLYQELRNYLDNQKFTFTYSNNYLNVLNYTKIIILEDDRIDLLCDNKIIKIKGKDLKLNRLLNNEIMIHGQIFSIELNNYE
jgi:sporulation protein YqfC